MLFGRFRLLLLLALLNLSLCAKDSFKDFKRFKNTQNKDMSTQQDSTIDTKIAKFSNYKLQPPKKLYSTKKPEVMAKTEFIKPEPLGPKVYIDIPKKEPLSPPNLDGNIELFGTNFSINIPIVEDLSLPAKEFIKYLQKQDISTTIADIKSAKNEFSLNDWAIYLLVQKVSTNSLKSKNSKLLAWMIFNELEYDVKYALVGDEPVLLYNIKDGLYEAKWCDIDSKIYYILENINCSSIYSYEDTKTLKPLDLSLAILPRLSYDIREKTIGFEYDAKRYSFTFSYNKNLLDFLDSYPEASSDIYFNSPLDELSRTTLLSAIAREINTKKSTQALDFVLKLVQNSFVYESDSSQFKKQKSMFALQTLFYANSDSEDRAVLFSYLVRELFGFETVGLMYDDHFVVGLDIPLDGDSIKIDKRDFLISDPTYQNGKIGQTQLKYSKIKPLKYIIVK
ncbi:MAG: hypothetical protein WC144_04500 [Sulfurimonas sp.]|jgi:hypothetical protein|nr:hypothetical protein [Sulfurimonadaceae bacterium]